MSLAGIRNKNIKESIVAIGLGTVKNSRPTIVIGSGFLVNKQGFVLTAKHVLQECQRLLKTPNFAKNALYSFKVNIIGDKVNVDKSEIYGWSRPVPDTSSDFYIKEDVDVALLVPKRYRDLPYLEIKTDPPQLYNEVCICGFPGGNQSFAISDPSLQFDFRFSPMTQFGRISSLIPFDTNIPKAIQTDIVTTGGSSGSPIIDPTDAKVIGIATSVIGGTVSGNSLQNNKHVSFFGYAKVGPVFGPSSNYFSDMVNRSLDIAKGDDVRGKSLLTHIGKVYSKSVSR